MLNCDMPYLVSNCLVKANCLCLMVCFLAGSYKCKNRFQSATVDVVYWPASSFSCVVFYDGWFVDFVAGHTDCAAHRTVTVFDVWEWLPHHHVQVLYPDLLSLQLFWEYFCFYNQLNILFWLFKKFAFCVSFALFWPFHVVYFIITRTMELKQ